MTPKARNAPKRSEVQLMDCMPSAAVPPSSLKKADCPSWCLPLAFTSTLGSGRSVKNVGISFLNCLHGVPSYFSGKVSGGFIAASIFFCSSSDRSELSFFGASPALFAAAASGSSAGPPLQPIKSEADEIAITMANMVGMIFFIWCLTVVEQGKESIGTYFQGLVNNESLTPNEETCAGQRY